MPPNERGINARVRVRIVNDVRSIRGIVTRRVITIVAILGGIRGVPVPRKAKISNDVRQACRKGVRVATSQRRNQVRLRALIASFRGMKDTRRLNLSKGERTGRRCRERPCFREVRSFRGLIGVFVVAYGGVGRIGALRAAWPSDHTWGTCARAVQCGLEDGWGGPLGGTLVLFRRGRTRLLS